MSLRCSRGSTVLVGEGGGDKESLKGTTRLRRPSLVRWLRALHLVRDLTYCSYLGAIAVPWARRLAVSRESGHGVVQASRNYQPRRLSPR